MPAMMEAGKLGSRAAKVGFDWPDANGLFAKLNEEIGELRSEVEEDVTDPAVAEELGDLLFTAVNLARHLKVDPEQALRGANAKFRRRFVAMENEAGGHEVLAGLEPEELERLWGRAKVAAGEAENTRLEDQTKR
jgi:XTP/dITP diphosphohydrolase/ATP diphosphatase